MAGTNTWVYPQTSPYHNTDIVDNKYLDVLNYRPIPATASDVFYTLPAVYQYRPDLLAHDLYNDSTLWWVFAARNPNLIGPDPYFNFVAGIGIYIPPLTVIKAALGI